MAIGEDNLFERNISRREILEILGGMAVAGILDMSFPISALSAPARKPNIIFILSDDHRWDHMSCMGHPFLETPNLDRIAREGTLCENAFVTSSLCSPSRASFLTRCPRCMPFVPETTNISSIRVSAIHRNFTIFYLIPKRREIFIIQIWRAGYFHNCGRN